jgi:hypothetical protein
MEFKQTRRGQLRADFRDRYGALCSIQESSIPGEDCIWMGVDVNFEGDEVQHGRMHLTQDQARSLIPILRHFARRGSLGIDTTEDPYHVGAWVVGVGEENRGMEGRVVQAAPGHTLTVQDIRKAGPEGQVTCVWDVVDLIWEPIDVPEDLPTRYDVLIGTDDPEP